MRSYDSRKEPPPEFDCTIWQAGRATCATGLAFKPIQIGQHVFTDEGPGTFNPSPQVLDEATVNEWPGREVGVFVSVGTGKRPGGTNHKKHEWWEDFFAGSLGAFAEARRRLIDKIEGCEDIHQSMLREHLPKHNVSRDNYFRLNVEVGVGEFGMNEWNRLADISTSTRRYLSKPEVKKSIVSASIKFAQIDRLHRRQPASLSMGGIGNKVVPGNGAVSGNDVTMAASPQTPAISVAPSSVIPDAIELPAEVPEEYIHGQNRLSSQSLRQPMVVSDDALPAHPTPQEATANAPARHSMEEFPSYRMSEDSGWPVSGQQQYTTSPQDNVGAFFASSGPPPVPPKTPIPYPENPDDVARVAIPTMTVPPLNVPNKVIPPYPVDEAPPTVNRQTKPSYHVR